MVSHLLCFSPLFVTYGYTAKMKLQVCYVHLSVPLSLESTSTSAPWQKIRTCPMMWAGIVRLTSRKYVCSKFCSVLLYLHDLVGVYKRIPLSKRERLPPNIEWDIHILKQSSKVTVTGIKNVYSECSTDKPLYHLIVQTNQNFKDKKSINVLSAWSWWRIALGRLG